MILEIMEASTAPQVRYEMEALQFEAALRFS